MELFAVVTPGLEAPALEEIRAAGFAGAARAPGGVTFEGGWEDAVRANLCLRGPTRILARVDSFMAFHLAQLDKRARRVDWGALIRPGTAVRVETSTSRKSKIYHAGAATQRIEGALAAAGYPLSPEAPVQIKARIEDNRVTLSVDTSGESLHRRGHKQAMAKAPLRETMAALLLRACGYDGAEPVLDPMCGSGTIPIEAAEIAAGFWPGRGRDFAFAHLLPCETVDRPVAPAPVAPGPARIHASDRDEGAVRAARENAERAGVADRIAFACADIRDLAAPDGPVGLVLVNPPYGTRIGNKGPLFGLHATLGERLLSGFSGWRVGLLTSEPGLAKATGLPFLPPGPPIAHGGLKVRLYRTDPLP